jgi:hypothetical protein
MTNCINQGFQTQTWSHGPQKSQRKLHFGLQFETIGGNVEHLCYANALFSSQLITKSQFKIAFQKSHKIEIRNFFCLILCCLML